jgi:hypothetical protein
MYSGKIAVPPGGGGIVKIETIPCTVRLDDLSFNSLRFFKIFNPSAIKTDASILEKRD